MAEKREEAKIKIEIEKLYGDMDDAIMTLIKGRALRNDTMIANAQYKMESLMVQTQQVLIYVLESLGIEPFKPIKSRTYEDLEEASRNYADNEEYGDDMYYAIKAAFKVGAQWKEQQMMQGAVEVYVCTNLDKTRKIPCSTEWGGRIPWNAIFENCNVGDKVKLIIVKEG